MGDRHVAPRSDAAGWQVADGAAGAIPAVHETQDEAIDHARQLLEQDGGGELIIHKADGQIRDKRTISATGGTGSAAS